MSDEFRQEVETQETYERLHRDVMLFESLHPDGLELMVSFNPDFQMKVDVYCRTASLYDHGNYRQVFGWPWFSDTGQEEKYKIWKRLVPG